LRIGECSLNHTRARGPVSRRDAKNAGPLKRRTIRRLTYSPVLYNAVFNSLDREAVRLLAASKKGVLVMASEASVRAVYETQTESQYDSYIYLDELLESSQGDQDIRNEFEGIVGSSQALCGVLDQIRMVAPADSTVLIEGETGTGKELIANAIHARSARRNHPFVKLNCAAIPVELLESELFGHEKGAFTGAVMQRLGRFEVANGGTLFLDEIGDIPLELQGKLLRVLQEQEFERLGSTRTRRVDVRIVAATNQDLAGLVAEKQFR